MAALGEKGRLLEGQRRDRDGHGEVKEEEMGHVRGRGDRWDRWGDTDKNPGAEMWEPPRGGRERQRGREAVWRDGKGQSWRIW